MMRASRFLLIFFLTSCLVQQYSFARDILISTANIQDSRQPQYYLLSVGINDYQDEFWPSLKWPANDAQKIINQFGKDTKFTVSQSFLTNEQATRQNIQSRLNQIAQQAQIDDTVILYFSGHGTLEKNEQGDLARVLVTHDTRNDHLLTTGLTHQWLRHWLDKLKAKKKMIIFATCNSGVGKSKLPESISRLLASQKGPLVALEDVSEGALILAAAAKGEAAREDDNLQGDIYTHFLLKALELYDRNRDGMVSALEAHDYAREQTWSFTRGKQRPTADVELIGNADIPLYGKKQRSALPVLEAYDETLAGFQIRVDNGLKGRLPFAFALKPEGSLVELYSPVNHQLMASYHVDPGVGNRITLDQVVNQRPFGIGVSLRQYNWQDKAWQKLTGSKHSRELLLNLGLHYREFGAGFSYARQLKDYGQEIRPTLQSDNSLKSWHLFLTYRKSIQKFQAGVSASLGRETLIMHLTDEVTRQSLKFQDKSNSRALEIFLGYEIKPELFLALEAGYKRANWQFNEIGDLDGERYWLGLNMHYQFDWRARKL